MSMNEVHEKSNPEFWNQLLDGKFHPVEDGLEIRLEIDCLDFGNPSFEFKLDGKKIGSIYGDGGGHIHPDFENGGLIGPEESPDLMNRVVNRLTQLFPGVMDQY